MRVEKRRRREGKTDYKARLKLLESELPRIVVRKSNRYIVVQYVKSEHAQDRVLLGVSSKELLEYGWPKEASGSLKSIPACYLTGLIFGKEIKARIKEEKVRAILDIGLGRNIKKSRVYSVLKGIVDCGIEIPHDKKVFSDEKRIQGMHLKHKINIQEIKNKILK